MIKSKSVLPFSCYLLMAFLLGGQMGLFAQSTHKPLLDGDRQYDLENYKAAEKQYRIAADLEHSNPLALYNLGNSFYQQGKFEDAASRFEQAAKFAPDKENAANALYNKGNALLKQRKYKDAVEAYENSLRIRPGDKDAKMNLQMAKKKLEAERKEQEQKQQQQQQQQQDQSGSEQPQDQPQGQEGEQPQQPQQPQQPDQQQEQPQGNQPQEQPQQPKPQTGDVKKEEAERLLETAVGPEDQRNARKYRSNQQRSKPKGAKKDW